MTEEIAEQIIAAKMDTKDDYLNDIRAGDDKPDFKAHLLGGPKLDDFSIERD